MNAYFHKNSIYITQQEQPWIRYRAYREGTITQTLDPLDVRCVSIIQLFSGTDIHRCLHLLHWVWYCSEVEEYLPSPHNESNNKITEFRTILQRESQNS
jgi:hypothetical protein